MKETDRLGWALAIALCTAFCAPMLWAMLSDGAHTLALVVVACYAGMLWAIYREIRRAQYKDN